MDEKTEELRDIFMDVSDDATVTETQEEGRGSLATDEEGVDEGIAAVVDRMQERFAFETELDADEYVVVVRGFYDSDDDATIAEEIDESDETVFQARLDLHLFRDEDTDAPFDLDEIRGEADPDHEELAAEFEASADEVARYARVLEAQAEARTVSHRFQSEFEDVLADAGLSTTMTESVREDGLDEATEDIGSLESDADVSF